MIVVLAASKLLLLSNFMVKNIVFGNLKVLRNKMINRILSAILIFVCVIVFQTKADEKKFTNFFLTGNIYLNGNIYQSDFQYLPGESQKNQEFNFSNAFAIKPAFGIGAEYKINDMPWNPRYGFKLLYSDISAKFSEDEFIGNYIYNNSYTQINVNHSIDANIKLLTTEHNYYVYPFEMPLSFNIGLQIGIPITTEFTQVEKIVSPAGIKFTDTGKETRRERNGKIPNASSLYSALLIGARYEAYKAGDLVFQPEIQFNLGLTDMVSSISWKSSAIRAGLSISYNIPEAEIPPPPPPAKAPMPELKEPIPARLAMNTIVTHNSKILENNSTIILPILANKVNVYYSLVPKIFFDKNTAKPINAGNKSNKDVMDADKLDFALAVKDYVKVNNSLNYKAVISYTNDEDESAKSDRIKFVEDLFNTSGIDKSKYSIETKLSDEKFSIEKLAEEARNVEIYADGKMIINNEFAKSFSAKAEPIMLNVNSEILADAQPVKYNADIYYNSDKILSLNKPNQDFTLDRGRISQEEISKMHTLKIVAKVIDSEQQEQTKEFNFILEPKINELLVKNNIENDNSQKYILGYFRFDESEFCSIDESVVSIVKNHIESGKKIEILSLCDNIGSEDYNIKLSQKRANTAVKTLNLTKNDYEIKIQPMGLFSNDTPYGRMMNRSILIILKN